MTSAIDTAFEDGIEQERIKQEKLRKQEQLEAAGKMLAEGLDIKMISHITGLSIAEIEILILPFSYNKSSENIKKEFDPGKFYNASCFSKADIDNYLNSSKAEWDNYL